MPSTLSAAQRPQRAQQAFVFGRQVRLLLAPERPPLPAALERCSPESLPPLISTLPELQGEQEAARPGRPAGHSRAASAGSAGSLAPTSRRYWCSSTLSSEGRGNLGAPPKPPRWLSNRPASCATQVSMPRLDSGADSAAAEGCVQRAGRGGMGKKWAHAGWMLGAGLWGRRGFLSRLQRPCGKCTRNSEFRRQRPRAKRMCCRT